MHIYVADHSPERGQRAVLVQQHFRNYLYSFAYIKDQGWKATLNMWEEFLRIHLAATSGERRHNGQGIRTILNEEGKRDHLMSYAYESHEPVWAESWNAKDFRPRVIIDSGAFTAFTCGKVIDPRDYAKWALGFSDRWQSKMASLDFMNLDVIGDQDASWKNQSILEGFGLKPLPIVTFGADKKHLQQALGRYEYIALGGLVPYTRQPEKLKAWLDRCFAMIMIHRKETGIMPKIHLLGITTEWCLQRYPCFSSDSSSWVASLRFGEGRIAGIKQQLPRYKESDAAMAATLHTIRTAIIKTQKLEKKITKLWSERGIKWDEAD